MNVMQAIAVAMVLGLERLDAQLLLLHALGRPAHDRAWLLAHDPDPLPPAIQSAVDTSVPPQLGGQPVADLTGPKELFGRGLAVARRGPGAPPRTASARPALARSGTPTRTGTEPTRSGGCAVDLGGVGWPGGGTS